METDSILLEQFITRYAAQAAQAIEQLTDTEITAFLQQAPLPLTLRLMEQMRSYRGAKCLQLLRPELAEALIEKMDITLAESLLRLSEKTFRADLLNRIDPKLANALRQKLEYEANTVGALMTPSVFALGNTVLVRDAVEIIRQERARISSVVYVIDAEDRLEGSILLHELLLAEPDRKMHELTNPELPKFTADLPIQSISDHPAWRVHRSVPVVDRSEKLIGILDFASLQNSDGTTSKELTKEVLETSHALGELYRIGLTGLLQSMSK